MDREYESEKSHWNSTVQESSHDKCNLAKTEDRVIRDMQLRLLQLVEENNPILHEHIEDMPIPEIVSDETKAIVQHMIFSIRPQQLKSANAPYEKAAGMAATQWNIRKRIFLFSPNGSDGSIKVIFNPKYTPCVTANANIDGLVSELSEKVTAFNREACFSVPNCFGIVERYQNIDVTYFDENGELHTNECLSGWEARVWQHETDHLDGILYCDRKLGINAGPNCIEFYRGTKSVEPTNLRVK